VGSHGGSGEMGVGGCIETNLGTDTRQCLKYQNFIHSTDVQALYVLPQRLNRYGMILNCFDIPNHHPAEIAQTLHSTPSLASSATVH
jgi:hypothetical protein